jgi:BON domain
MDNSNEARHNDTRDARTQPGASARPVEHRPLEETEIPPAEEPALAGDITASPSNYSLREIEEGRAPLGEGMDRLIDPSIGRERMSANPDVLDLDESWLVESEEPDFMDSPGTVDVIEAVEEAEPYFPPTDPPLTTRPLTNAGMRGGFATGALEEPEEPEEEPLRVRGGDAEIAARVKRALLLDAYTTDMNIEVTVEDGVVYLTGQVRSLEDVEMAESVAGNVEGVEEVEEELEIV